MQRTLRKRIASQKSQLSRFAQVANGQNQSCGNQAVVSAQRADSVINGYNKIWNKGWGKYGKVV